MAQYNFTIQPYGHRCVDIQSAYHCLFKEAKGISEQGEASNVVMEQYAEADGARVYIPDDVKHKTTDVTISLLFIGDDPLADSIAFTDFVFGRKVEWHDTFRNLYVTLLLTKAPTVNQERLYGDRKYRLLTFTFTNIYGKHFNRSQVR